MDNFCDLCQISQRLFCACITQVMLDVYVSIFIRRRARPHGVGFFDISRHVSAVCLRCCIYTFFHVMLDGIFVFFSFSVNWTAFRFKTSDFVQWVHLLSTVNKQACQHRFCPCMKWIYGCFRALCGKRSWRRRSCFAMWTHKTCCRCLLNHPAIQGKGER